MEKVNILLSTYNGKKYLSELLQSIRDQDYSNLTVHIRDDGSNDDTLALCNSLCKNNTQWLTKPGNNIGIFGSFSELLLQSDADADYYSFCDQDDIWHKNKITNAVTKIQKVDRSTPALYCSRVAIVDQNRHPIKLSLQPIYISFESSLIENIAQGCTIVINKAARDLLIRYIPTNFALLHDWWYYLVISAFGVIIFDTTPGVDYRMHGKNVSYGKFGNWAKMIIRLKRFLKGEAHYPFTQAKILYTNYQHTISAEKKEILQNFISLPESSLTKRLRFLFHNPFKRQQFIDEILTRLMFLFVKYN
jgi:glycosyltransferase involved in cell wall biosynthesis